MSIIFTTPNRLFSTIMQVSDGNINLQVPLTITILGLVLGALALVSLSYLWITSRKKRIDMPRVERQPKVPLTDSSISDIASFDEAFEAIKNESLQETNLQLLRECLSKLLAICDKSDKEIPPCVTTILDWISGNLYNPNMHHFFLDCLLLIAQHDEKRKGLVRTVFLKELESLYDNSKSDPLPSLLTLLQQLNDFDEAFMIGLIDDAVLRWSDSAFEKLRSVLLLSEVNKTTGAYFRVKQYLLGSMIQAGKDGKEQARLRAEALHAQMKW